MNRIIELADRNGYKVIKGTILEHDCGAVFTVEAMWERPEDVWVEGDYIHTGYPTNMVGGYTSEGVWCSLPVAECRTQVER